MDIARRLKRSPSTVNGWLKSITDQRRRKQLETIAILKRLGWTQAEIGKAVGLTQQRVQQAIQENPDSEKLVKTQLAQGKTPAQVAEFNDISETYAWALKLDPIREDTDRAMVAARVREYHEARAKERKIAAGKATGRGNKKVVENLPQPLEAGKARDLAGQAVGVSGLAAVSVADC